MRILFSFILLICSLHNSFAQIEDGSFEKWDTAYYWILPVNSQYELVPSIWKSNNEIHPDWHPFLVSTPASRSEESPVDEFSAKVASRACGIDACYSGWMYQNIPLKNLNEISFWIKCDSLYRRSGCFIEVFGFNNPENLDVIYTDSIKEENLDFFEYSINVGDFSSIEYDSIRLQFRAKGVIGFEEEHLLGYTILLVDGVESKYLSKSNEEKEGIILFPNPFSNKLNIESTISDNIEIEILDLFGRTIKKSQCSNGNCKLDLEELVAGVYFLRTKNKKGAILVRKILKRKP